MEITTDLVKQLRDKTGVSIMQCKKALEETGGDMEKATMLLLKKSADIASKKSDRTLNAGVVSTYVHSTGNVGTMLELLCETDFVAKNEEFKALARDIAMHATATNPQFLKREDVDSHANDLAKEMFMKEVEGKPEEMKEKILEGKLNSYWGERVLLNQAFIKNPEVTIQNLLESATQKFGEKIELSRFVRYSVTQ
ncbi:MAG: translation elongation factor Ts [Parcubacteria bacterium C7867-003]|nr:MAG: translation elongation factor Ts [Parcubacteria bacterium C7867-003]